MNIMQKLTAKITRSVITPEFIADKAIEFMLDFFGKDGDEKFIKVCTEKTTDGENPVILIYTFIDGGKIVLYPETLQEFFGRITAGPTSAIFTPIINKYTPTIEKGLREILENEGHVFIGRSEHGGNDVDCLFVRQDETEDLFKLSERLPPIIRSVMDSGALDDVLNQVQSQ